MKRNSVYKLIIGFGITGCLLFILPVLSYSQVSDPLPEGWKNTDIGEPELLSKTFYDAENDFYTLSGGGYDTWGNADECNFVYFETEEDKEVVVRMLDFVGTGWNSKGFIMIRSSLEPEASMCFLEVTPHTDENSCYLSGRPLDGGGCDIFGVIVGLTPLYPRWIKFVRQGKYITGYHKDDTEDAQWERVATVELTLKGKAYLGIGVCGGGSGTGYVTVSFDQLEVRDIEIPYELNNPTRDRLLGEGGEVNIDVTNVFGHYIGDYWTVEAESSDEGIVTASFYETKVDNPEDGEEYRKYIKVTGISDGVAAIKLSANINGFKMYDEFVVDVVGINPTTESVEAMAPPSPWIFNEISDTSEMEFTGSISNRVKIVTLLSNEEGPEDNVSFLYQELNNSDSIQMLAYIDTLKNTGRGSFAGLMIRESFDNALTDRSPYTAFSIGAYQGLKFNFRWDLGVEVSSLDDENVTLPCWLRLNKYREYGNDYIQVYYSYDSLYWQQFLKYPFYVQFFNDEIVGGLVVSGGNYTSERRKEMVIVNNLRIKINQQFDPIIPMEDIESLKEPLEISPNPVSTSATITYKIIKPGRVILSVYDSYGILRDVIVNEVQNIGVYSVNYDPSRLEQFGIYLLKLISEGDYQFVRFIYTNN
jgi:hypothetical protein